MKERPARVAPANGGREPVEGRPIMTSVSLHRRRLCGRRQAASDLRHPTRWAFRSSGHGQTSIAAPWRSDRFGRRRFVDVSRAGRACRAGNPDVSRYAGHETQRPCSSAGQSTRLVSEMSPVRSRPGAPIPPGESRRASLRVRGLRSRSDVVRPAFEFIRPAAPLATSDARSARLSRPARSCGSRFAGTARGRESAWSRRSAIRQRLRCDSRHRDVRLLSKPTAHAVAALRLSAANPPPTGGCRTRRERTRCCVGQKGGS